MTIDATPTEQEVRVILSVNTQISTEDLRNLLYLLNRSGVTVMSIEEERVIYETDSDNNKRFFWRDKTGRDFTCNFNESELLGAIDENDTNDDGITIREWLLDEVEVGDEWKNRTQLVTRIS
jgi:hypothetical protein